MRKSADLAPLQSLQVHCASSFRVVDGANMGDALADASELVLDDVYCLSEGADYARLAIAVTGESGDFRVAAGSDLGNAGAALFLDAVVTFMSSGGLTIEVVILVEVNAGDGAVDAVYLLPLAALSPQITYRLVGIDRNAARSRFGEVACVSFTRGTLITLADGRQCAIDELAIGDRVLTRDSGPQAVRWIGHNTLRAIGEFAPITVRKGVLNNENDLTVSPNHRLFVYQRSDEIGVGRSEILVKARHLVNGDTVFQQDGGFVDYYQLLFDSHQIIYAEGIAAESLLLDTNTSHALPREVAGSLTTVLHDHKDSPHQKHEISRMTLEGRDAADLLRRASSSS